MLQRRLLFITRERPYQHGEQVILNSCYQNLDRGALGVPYGLKKELSLFREEIWFVAVTTVRPASGDDVR